MKTKLLEVIEKATTEELLNVVIDNMEQEAEIAELKKENRDLAKENKALSAGTAPKAAAPKAAPRPAQPKAAVAPTEPVAPVAPAAEVEDDGSYESMNLKDLRAYAQGLGIKGVGNASKGIIIAKINAFEGTEEVQSPVAEEATDVDAILADVATPQEPVADTPAPAAAPSRRRRA